MVRFVLTEQLLELGLYAGSLLLESGAEVYRIEDTIHRMARACGAQSVECIVTPTGLYLTVSAAGLSGTKVRRIRMRSTNLARVSAINTLSRNLRGQDNLPSHVFARLEQIVDSTAGYPTWVQYAAAVVGGTAFAALFGANGLDLPAAALCSLLVFASVRGMSRFELPRLLADFVGGIVAGAAALSLTLLFPTMHYDRVILGSIMSLVPGVLLTNAVRDMLAGDLLSGTTRMSEALFIAAGIAAGVGAVLGWWLRWSPLAI